jgi:LacI family transcriptional regulator
MAQKKVNIKDVAARAGVHPSTVSRVMNPDTVSMVSQRVAERVANIARELGYRRSPIASGLRTGRSYTIGVLIPDLTNPIFPPIVRSIERALGEQGYIAILADSDNKLESEQAILDSMKSRNVDGLILATAHRNDAAVEACLRDQIPLVLVNRSIESHAVTEVINDDEKGIRLAIEHLLELGHRDIAYVGGPQDTTTGRDRYKAFKKVMRAHHLEPQPELMLDCSAFTEAEGHQGLLSLLSKRRDFSAVVAANDLLALGCYDALQAAGLRCPNDVSVTGFNDTPFMDRISPPLTTVRIPLDEMGAKAAKLLLLLIREPETKNVTVRLEPTLVVRGSTARPCSSN